MSNKRMLVYESMHLKQYFVYNNKSIYSAALLTVKNVDFHGRERFPADIDVVFTYQDKDVTLQLQRDDEATEMLSEELFHTSKILPSGLFKDSEKDVSKDDF